MLLVAGLASCGGNGDPPAPRNVTAEQVQSKEARKDLQRARRMVKARKENVRGGVELAGFAQQIQQLTTAGARGEIEALFVDPKALSACTFARDKGAQMLSFEQVEELLAEKRNRLSTVAPQPDSTVIALIHKVRPRKRMLGARIGGDDCRVESRGRVNVVMQPAAPPPDAIENHFEAVFIDGRWWLISYERTERDCSDLGAPEAFGCRALRGAD